MSLNAFNATIGDMGMFFTPHALKSLNSIQKIRLRVICATFNGIACATIIL